MVYRPVEAPAGEAPPPVEPDLSEVVHTAVLTVAGRRHELDGERTVLGRSKDCDIQVSDPNVSRRHAEVRRDGGAFVLVDLDSTNGVEVGGKRVKRLELQDGSRFTLGSTEIVFSEELA
jgi:pSer/pThr/pTyr-binding forkhead associated (FHA) protein